MVTIKETTSMVTTATILSTVLPKRIIYMETGTSVTRLRAVMTSSTLAGPTTVTGSTMSTVAEATIESTAKAPVLTNYTVSGVMTRSLAVMAITTFGETITSKRTPRAGMAKAGTSSAKISCQEMTLFTEERALTISTEVQETITYTEEKVQIICMEDLEKTPSGEVTTKTPFTLAQVGIPSSVAKAATK